MIVLDTHAWIWLVSKPSLLTRKVRNAINREERLGVSAISCWEVAMLAAKKRITVDRPVDIWVEQALSGANIELLPLTPKIAVLSANLDGFHGDPADRIIVTTALDGGATLVTKDAKILKAKLCPTIWE